MSEYIYDEREIYYVYKWYNVDTDFVFYVGKGMKDRYKETKLGARSKLFVDYYNNNNCEVEIVVDCLSEKDAFDVEIKMINYHKNRSECTCNKLLGGQGGPVLYGKDNPMFGKTHSPEIRAKISKILKDGGKSAGENNPMFGIGLRERMDEKTWNGWIEKHEQLTGDKNPNFGNRKLSKIYAENKEYAKEKQGRLGIANGRCRKVAMFLDDFYMEFDYMGLCAEYMIDNNLLKSKNIASITTRISITAKNGKQYSGYYFKFLDN